MYVHIMKLCYEIFVQNIKETTYKLVEGFVSSTDIV